MTDIEPEEPWVDIGHDVSVQRRYIDGQLMGVAYRHPCRDGQFEAWVHVDGPGAWDLVQADPLTVTPSFLCRICGHHGFITEGRWAPA